MPRFFRKYRRTFRRRRFSRRAIRRTRPGSKRFFRKQRRWAKPEVKWIVRSSASTPIAANAITNGAAISPNVIPVGPGISERIGNSIKLRKLLFNIQFTTFDDEATDVRADGVIRVILWTPTQNHTFALDYLQGITIDQWQLPLDWNRVRVHRDLNIRIGFDKYVFTADNTDYLVQTVYPTRVARKFVIPFPRTIAFAGNTGDSLDINKDMMYMTIFNPNTFRVNYDFDSKLTYIDP